MTSTVQEKKKATTTTRLAPKTTTKAKAPPTQDDIALRARLLYENAGHPGGRDLEFWLEAERQLREELDT